MRNIKYKNSEELNNMVAPSKGANRSSIGVNNKVQEYFLIDVNDIIPFHHQARKNFSEEEIQVLAESIKEHGVTNPLTIIPSEEIQGQYEVVSGERRLRASKLAGLERVPCILIHDYKQAEALALVENLHRQDLHPIELGLAIEKLMLNKICLSQVEVAQKLSLSKTVVSEHIKYAKIDEEVRDYLISHSITNQATLRKLTKFIDDPSSQKRIIGMIKNTENIKEKSFSVLRISYYFGELDVKKLGIKKLDSKSKASFKEALKSIIRDLE